MAIKRIHFIILMLVSICSISCEKWFTKYDLFPIDVGMEYFFSYSGKQINVDDIIGKEKWTITGVSAPGDNIIYNCTKDDTRVDLRHTINGGHDTMGIRKTESQFTISENKKSHRITFGDISFKRFQNEKRIIIYYTTSWTNASWEFKADSGLTYYSYYHKPNQWTQIFMHLDSLKRN